MTTDVLAFTPEQSVRDAMVALFERNIDAAPVVDADNRVVGMLSTADLIVQESELHFPTMLSVFGATLELPSAKRHFEDDLRRSLGSTVQEVMSGDPITCADDDTIEKAATLMHDHDASRLAVLRAGRLVGVISRNDILRVIIQDQ